MCALRIRFGLIALLGCTSGAKPDPLSTEIAAWASGASYTLSTPPHCAGIEERYFGALGSVCWSAKSKIEQPPAGSRMFPRFEITVAMYDSEDKAKARIARFGEVPPALNGPDEYTQALRAAFHVGSSYVTVTTDAGAFEPDMQRAIRELASAVGGTDLTCVTACR
jgi:hypothetical protein